MHRTPRMSPRRLTAAAGLAAAAAVVLSGGGPAQAAPVQAPLLQAATAPATAPASAAAAARGAAAVGRGHGLVARTVLSGKGLGGLTKPDDLTALGGRLFVAFQNGVPSTGGAKGTPARSTVVEFTRTGRVLRRWQLTGKCDGLTADPTHHRLIATVNEDGNSALYTIPVTGHHRASRFRFDAQPLPHGGGTDSITIDRGRLYLVASAPTAGTYGPALYQVRLVHTTAKLTAVPFFDATTATLADAGGHHRAVHLALTDPDSSTVVPARSPRFAGDFMLDAQGDRQQVYVSHLGVRGQHLWVLRLSRPVDDTAWATTTHGTLLEANTAAGTVDALTGSFDSGTAYVSITPEVGAHHLGTLNLRTGAVHPVRTGGSPIAPSGLLYLP